MSEDSMDSRSVPNDRQIVADNRRLVDLWDMHASRSWSVRGDRHGTNVALINAFTSQAVHLTRAALLLHSNGMDFQAVPLIRATLECAVTASWLAVYPEKTQDHLRASTQQRKTLLDGIVEAGMSGEPGLSETVITLEKLDSFRDPEGKVLEKRCAALRGGDHLYLMYRVMSAYSHPGSSLADEYVQLVPRGEDNPWGLVLLDDPRYDDGVRMLGINSALLLRAQIAADSILVKPRHRTQLERMAKRFGVSPTIERS